MLCDNVTHWFLNTLSASSFWEGHEFTRAVKSLEMCRASALEVSFLRARRVFPQPFSVGPRHHLILLTQPELNAQRNSLIIKDFISKSFKLKDLAETSS
jgi:hypothetical protein